MHNLRNRVSAFALAVVLASAMVGIFNAPVRASDGSAPTVSDACAALAAAEADLAKLPAPARVVLQRLIDAAQKALGC